MDDRSIRFAMAVFLLLVIVVALASVRSNEKASVVLSFQLCNAINSSISPVAAGAADDDDVQLRKEAMVQALGVVARFDMATTDAEAVRQVKRALAVLNREVEAHPQQWKPIFKALDKATDGSADDRSREEASAELKVLPHRKLGPCPNCLKRDLGICDL